jgi:chromosome segregation ATPase
VSEPVESTEQQTEAPEAEEQQSDELSPEALRKQLEKARKEAANYRTKVRELEPLATKAKELEDAGRTELEKLTARAETAERERGELQARALRLEVAFEKGLTPGQAKRLVGGSREELEADAEEILRDFPVKPDPNRRFQGGADTGPRLTAPPSDPRAADLAQIEADLRAASRR